MTALQLPIPSFWAAPPPDAPRLAVRAVPSADSVGDADLVVRARGGDRWAEEALYRRHVRYVTGLVARLLGRYGDVEDVVQDTFVIALEQLATLREPAAVRGWLAQIAVSQVRRRFRRRKLMRVLGLDRNADDVALADLAVEQASGEARAELGRLDTALRVLPVELRLAWMLRRVEGFELVDAAAACGCSLATVKRRIAEAEEHVRAHLEGRAA